MSQALMTIEQYIAEIRKKDTIFIGFNAEYAKVFLGMTKHNKYEDPFEWLDKETTNWEKREAFKKFMTDEMSNIRLTDVFDNVPLSYELWPFLGTIAIDIDAGSPEKDVINNRYEDKDGEPISLDAVVYIMTYERATRANEKRKALEDDE